MQHVICCILCILGQNTVHLFSTGPSSLLRSKCVTWDEDDEDDDDASSKELWFMLDVSYLTR